MNEVFHEIEHSTPLIVQLQSGLTSRPAISPENGGDGEYEKFLYLKNVISKWNFDFIDEIFAPDERVTSKIRPSLITGLSGKNPNKTIWFITHLDVVPPGDENLWDTPPFEAVEKDGIIYGRGVEDNQQATVSTLIALKAIKDSGIKPEINIKLLFVADEEMGSEYGIQWILDNENLFTKDDLIITPDVGDPDGQFIEIAEKSILWTAFHIKGKQSHGSRPDLGINAARASSYLCVELDNLYNKFDKQNPLFDIPYSTFEPTKRQGSVSNLNTIPGYELLGLDCRVLPCYSLEEIKSEISSITEKIEEKFKVKITQEILQNVQAPDPTPTDAPVVTLLENSIKSITGKTPQTYGIGGGTVAAYFRMRGYNAVLWSTLNETLHCPNEASSIKNTINDAKVFVKMMLDAK